jgi:selenide,water dikinase
VLVSGGANALTDVTGFGLLGHLRNMTTASRAGAKTWLAQVPVLPAAWEYLRAGIAPGGTHANWRFLNDWVNYAADVTKEEQLALCDAQTSGGLLAAVPKGDVQRILASLHEAGLTQAAIIGEVTTDTSGRIVVSRAP